MDGFAVRCGGHAGDVAVVARDRSRRPAPRALEAGEAMAIATGGVVPEGADAVIPVEYVVEGDNEVEIPDVARVGANVRPRGGDVRCRRRVVPAGTRLGPAQIGALAAAGVAEVVAARRPRVAVLATGTELRRPGESLGPGEVYEANGLMLATQLEVGGADGRAPGGRRRRRGRPPRGARARARADVLVTSGGVSVGPHDLVRRIGAELGVEEVFWRVAVKPGKPVSFGVREWTLVFGLPGNPVSSLVGVRAVRAAMRLLALQGAADPWPRFRAGACLRQRSKRNSARDELVRARADASSDAARSCSSPSSARSRT